MLVQVSTCFFSKKLQKIADFFENKHVFLLLWPKTPSNRTHKLIQVITSSCILIQNRSSESSKLKGISLSVAIFFPVLVRSFSSLVPLIPSLVSLQDREDSSRSKLRYTPSQFRDQVAIRRFQITGP